MLRVIPFKQRAEFCGPASLKIVLKYYGINKSEKEIAKLCQCSKSKGTTGENILKAAKKLGLRGKIKDNSEIKDISYYIHKKKIPIIVPWFSVYEDHYSVVIGIDRDNIYIIDPELGHIRAMKVKRFATLWFDLQLNNKPIKSKDQVVIRRIIVVHR